MSIDQCVAHCLVCASVRSGHLTGVPQRIKEYWSRAVVGNLWPSDLYIIEQNLLRVGSIMGYYIWLCMFTSWHTNKEASF